MAERLTIKIIPSEGGNGVLTVESTMRQVLDTVLLLNSGGAQTKWQLVSATTNSPFTVVAEGESDVVASRQKEVFVKSVRELSAGQFPVAWRRPELAQTAANFIQRSADEIGATEFDLQDGSVSITLTNEDAVLFEGLPGILKPYEALPIWTKRQIGSIDSVLVEVTTHYGKPAVQLEERKTRRQTTCVIPKSLPPKFSDLATVQDVWAHRRLIVR